MSINSASDGIEPSMATPLLIFKNFKWNQELGNGVQFLIP